MNEKERFKEIVSIIKSSGLFTGITPEKVCNTITRLGPTFIKIGQIMSSRYDVLPKEYCDSLSKLRSNVEPMKYREVNGILKHELGDPDKIFESIEKEPIGSASIAQVHKAKLLSGEDVVIKVQREKIFETMTMDVMLFKKVIKLFHLNLLIKIMDLSAVLDELYNVAKEEMDFELEARHIQEFKENNIEINYVDVPIVYSKFVTKKVLVMEYVDGIDFNNRDLLIENGYDLEEIGLKLANNYIKQALDDGYFHADPHPDNICIRDGKIIFLDFGMMGRISNRNKNLLKKAMKAIIREDVSELEHILLSISTTDDNVDHPKLRAGIQRILEKNANTDIKDIDIISFVMSISLLFRDNNIRLDNNITLLMRGICVIEGTLEQISPNINLIMVFNNKINEGSINEFFSKDLVLSTGKNIANNLVSLSELPSEMLNLVRDLNRGQIKVDIEMANSNKQVNKLEKMLHQLIIGVLDAAVLLGASFVQNDVLRWIYVVLAVIFTIWLFIQMLKDHFHNGY